MNKVIEIFKAWGIAFNPTHEQAGLASKRVEVCNDCEFKKDTPIIHCGACGCALRAKIYSPIQGACPKGFWNDIDKEFFDNKKHYDSLKK